jgi:hypothetical protein
LAFKPNWSISFVKSITEFLSAVSDLTSACLIRKNGYAASAAGSWLKIPDKINYQKTPSAAQDR